MADLKFYDIILKPAITERSMILMESKKYVFYVHPDANKVQIKEAVEKMFEGVKVDKINTMNISGKKRRRGKAVGRTPDRKKAIVKLKPDSQDIELFTGV